MAGADAKTVLRSLVRQLREEARFTRTGCRCSEQFDRLADAAEHRLANGWTEAELERQAKTRLVTAALDASEPDR